MKPMASEIFRYWNSDPPPALLHIVEQAPERGVQLKLPQG